MLTGGNRNETGNVLREKYHAETGIISRRITWQYSQNFLSSIFGRFQKLVVRALKSSTGVEAMLKTSGLVSSILNLVGNKGKGKDGRNSLNSFFTETNFVI